MQKVADLHIHSYQSDGTFSPERVVKYSKTQGLSAIAITDHDCCSGIAPAVTAAKALGIEVIPGVELSAELDEGTIHILGYFIDWQRDWFLKKLDEISMSREERARNILNKLKECDIVLSEKELFELSGPGSVGRLHIANLMVKKGLVSSVGQAFVKYIGNDRPCYVRNFKLLPEEAVKMIKDIGGVPVLAHPKTAYIKDRSREDVIKRLISSGIQGIEVYHPDHTRKDENDLKALAKKYHLLLTGGSDCHGVADKEILIGKVRIPYELVEELRKAASCNRTRG